MQTLWRDLRYGLRMLAKAPGFTTVAVLTLAVGIGANTAIFSVVNAVLIRQLPYPNHASLLRIEETHPDENGTDLTFATFLDLQRDVKSIRNASAFRSWAFNVTGDGDAEQVPGGLVSGNFFFALGSRPLLGRVIGPQDDLAGGNNNVVVLSYALWRRRFGGDPAVLGKTLRVNSDNYVIIGVMPPGVDFPDRAEMWCPLVPGGSLHDNRRAHLLTVIANLAPGKSLGATLGELSAFAARVERQNPGVDDPGLAITATSLKSSLAAPIRPALALLTFAAGFLLLVACANAANLLFARASTRRKEVAIRLAIGANRSRLVRQLLTENVLLASLGGTLGLALAFWSVSLIVAANARNIPQLVGVGLDWRVLAFAFVVSLLAGLLSGLIPALTDVRSAFASSLKETAVTLASRSRHAMSEGLIVLQFAVAVVLLAGASLLANSFVRVLHVNPGFNPDKVLTMQVFLSPIQFPEGDPKGAVVLHEMLDSIRTLPSVRSAGLVISLPIVGGPSTDFVLPDRPAPRLGDEPSADIRIIDPGYLSTMQIPLVSGRNFTESDNQNSARVMIINQTMARQFWPHESPLGKHVTMKDWGPPLTGEIVGVIADVKLNGLDAAVGSAIYWPYRQFPVDFDSIVVRTDADPLRLAAAVKNRIWSADRNEPISKIATMNQVLSDSLATRRLYLVLLGVFAGAAIVLAAIGIYGMLSSSVTQRTHEIGIRVALGAQRTTILQLILGRGARLALVGVAVGVCTALGLAGLISSLLFGVSASDPATFVAVAGLLEFVALVACYIPARRAMRVDPIVALKYE